MCSNFIVPTCMATIEESTSTGTKPNHVFHTTRAPGLSYRQRANGERSYYGWLPHRGRVRLQATTPRAAEDEYRDLRGRVAKGERIAPSNLRFKAVADEWFENKTGRLRDWTRRGYRATLDNELLPRFGHRKLRDIGYEDILKFVRALESRGLSSSTIDSHLLVFRGVFKYARKAGYVSVSPVDLLDAEDRGERRERETDHVWSANEIEALLSSSEYLAGQPESRYDYSPILRTAIFTGLRLGELLGLQWQDINLETGELHVRRQWSRIGQYTEPKTKAAKRRVPLNADMVAFFRRHREAAFATGQASPGSPVFASRTGTPLSHRNVQRRGFDPARDRAEINGVTFHSLRHAFASRMIHGGVNPVQLAHVLGHEDARITLARYANLYDRESTDELIRKAMTQ